MCKWFTLTILLNTCYKTVFTGGNPANTGLLRVYVTVQDTNDNSPVFQQDTYTVTVPENIHTGTAILQVHAEDADTGKKQTNMLIVP